MVHRRSTVPSKKPPDSPPSVKRLLVSLLSCADFKDVLQAYRAITRQGRDPSERIITAIATARELPEEFRLGLMLCAEMSEAEIDLCCVCVRSASYRQATPFWRFERVAAFALRHRIFTSWLGPLLSPSSLSKQDRISSIKDSLRKRWRALEARLEKILELGRMQVDA